MIHSPAFLPQVGGLEIQTAMLARGLVDLGDDVTVLTRTPGGGEAESYSVVRNPNPREFLNSVRRSEVVLHQNLSLRGLWPLAVVRRPLVVAHHSWYRRTDGSAGVRDWIKRRVVARVAGSISVSRAIAEDLKSESRVVPNAYRDELFRDTGAPERIRTLLFVGRLVSDKGADLLIEALARLALGGRRPDLTVVGAGPDRVGLEGLAARLGVERQVEFAGLLEDARLSEAYRAHKIVVVPSRYEEPFGIVALEAIASGCVVVASEGGGLRDAVGPCGLLFANGDVPALADALSRLLDSPEEIEGLRKEAPNHLERHRPGAMVLAYREVLARAVAGGSE